MIIDFHTHVFSPEIKNNREKFVAGDLFFASLYSDTRAKLADTDDLIKNMDMEEIDKSVILNINWQNADNYRRSNEYILESISRFPQRLIGFCTVPLEFPDLALKELEYCLKNGIKGVGEIRPSKKFLENISLLEPVISCIIKNSLILLTHTSDPVGHNYPGKGDITPELIYSLILKFPELKLVCSHWGGGLPFYALMPEVKKALTGIYFDTAASPYLYSPQIYPIIGKLIGWEKILFGTDYPLLTSKRYLNEINGLMLPDETRKQILGENAGTLLGIL
jgi:predicted TIM-barrel fold metal-dependent hydrolase